MQGKSTSPHPSNTPFSLEVLSDKPLNLINFKSCLFFFCHLAKKPETSKTYFGDLNL